jgi:hypothetical protein
MSVQWKSFSFLLIVPVNIFNNYLPIFFILIYK